MSEHEIQALPAPSPDNKMAEQAMAIYENERRSIQHLLEGVRKNLQMFNVSQIEVDELEIILGFKAKPALKPCLFYTEQTGKRCLESGQGLAANHPERLCANCREMIELAIQATKFQAKRAMDSLKDEDRKDIMLDYCSGCGTKDPSCQCMNDE